MFYIHVSIAFSLIGRYVNTLMEIIFIRCLVHVSFLLFNNGWVINVVNSTICILLKQQFKSIILIIVVCIGELTQNSSTGIMFFGVFATEAIMVLLLIIESLLKIFIACVRFFDFQGQIIQYMTILIEHYKTFG